MLTDKQLKIGALVFLGILIVWSVLENQNNSDSFKHSAKPASSEKLPKEYLGPYSGIQPSYGIVLSDKVTSTDVGIAPESVFTFCFATEGRVVLQRHMVLSEGPEDYWCRGTYEIIEKNQEGIKIKCSLDCLTYGRDKAYILILQQGGKGARFEQDPSDIDAPKFALDKLTFSCEN